jgi:fatty acid desaturase
MSANKIYDFMFKRKWIQRMVIVLATVLLSLCLFAILGLPLQESFAMGTFAALGSILVHVIDIIYNKIKEKELED